MKKTTDFFIVEIDTTEHWDKDFLQKIKISKTITYYLFDKNIQTYCCELKQSFALHELYEIAHAKDGCEIDVYDIERFDNASTEATNPNAIYCHCDTIEKEKYYKPKYNFDFDYSIETEYYENLIRIINILQNDEK